jgi:hypothetical protein
MILPDKNITLYHSLLNCGAVLLSELKVSDTVFSLRERTKNIEILHNYEKFILTLDILYMIGAITIRDDIIVRCIDA